jgi:hypothetical protein
MTLYERSAPPRPNPFEVTKAVDFSDEEVVATFVDFKRSAGDGLFAIVDPRLAMPRLLVGSKGTGRTHLMRYYSASVQSLRHPEDPVAGMAAEGYVGVYLRCTGLNAGRFAEKGVDASIWSDVFAYYMDLWLAQLVLAVVERARSNSDILVRETDAVRAIVDLFDDFAAEAPTTVSELQAALHGFQREIDFAVNNASLSRNVDGVVIRVTRGRLPFGVPQILSEHVPQLAEAQWLYLIDELENLTADQQRYVQTIIREREAPASLMIGSQRSGVRTRQTYSAGVENKHGSEYVQIDLDAEYRKRTRSFHNFCADLVAQRLIEYGFAEGARDNVVAGLPAFFAEPPVTTLGAAETEFADTDGDRLAIVKLRRELERHRPRGSADAASIEQVVAAVRCPASALVEKLNVVSLYRAWASSQPLDTAAERIRVESRSYLESPRPGSYKRAVSHWRNDLIAQLLQEHQQKQRYAGFDLFVRAAAGVPRNLVILLKNIYRWSTFNGEQAFVEGQITEEAQLEGFLESASWFYRDSIVIGEHGPEVQDAIRKLADLFRALRFADKPPEVSLASFSVEDSAMSPQARAVLNEAAAWSLLIEIGSGQRDRNTRGVTRKFQLNPMLCPRWDLPIARRGAIALSASEADAIFDAERAGTYDAVVRQRVQRATVPFSDEGLAQGSLLRGQN